MVIDIHTHIFADALAPRAKEALIKAAKGEYTPLHDMTKLDLVRSMDEAGVDISVVQPVVTKRSQVEKVNEWAAQIEDDRIISFGGIWPHTPDYKEQIDLVASLGFKGIKFHCEYQDFVIDEKEYLPIYDYAFEKGLILLFHAGYDPAFPAPFKSSPERFANIARTFKDGTIIAAHLGGCRQWEDVARNMAPYENLYIDTSMGFMYYPQPLFLDIFNALGADRLLFGSDSPWSNPAQELEALRSLPVSDADKEKMLCGNAKKLLGI